ncbi:MAG: hypothetical protein HY861_03310 [Chlamydiia bacterium]|nr:hypothetical protein [Chlamydiia bacterium]
MTFRALPLPSFSRVVNSYYVSVVHAMSPFCLSRKKIQLLAGIILATASGYGMYTRST